MIRLKELFLPLTIDDKPLLPISRVAIDVEANTIQVAYLTESYSKATLTGLEEYQLNPGDARTYTQRLTAALKKVTPKIPQGAEVIVIFPSSKVVIKELTLPFLDAEKIRMVIEYEIEPIIPFKLENAIIDFIITGKSEVKESSTVMVVAAQKEEVRKVIDAFNKAGIEPDKVTIDLFSAISLFNQIPTYSKLKHAYGLIDIGKLSTRVALVSNQILVATRTIQRGTAPAPIVEEDGAVEEIGTAESQQAKLFNDILFTLNSFEVKQGKVTEIEKVFLLGNQQAVEAFCSFAQGNFHAPCETLAIEQLASNPRIKSAIATAPASWSNYNRALGALLPVHVLQEFNLRRKELSLSSMPLVRASLLAGLAIFALAIGGLATQIYLQRVEGSLRIKEIEQRELNRLRSALPTDAPGAKKKNIKALAHEVESHLEEQEDAWSSFTSEQPKPLEVLQELAQLFNKKKFDIDIEYVTIIRDEKQPNPIEVKGVFRSKISPGEKDFTHFAELANDLSNNGKLLCLTEEVDPVQLPDKGVSFLAHFKTREEGE